ncbi:MAG TPA: hypothetical protein VGE74_15750 [Gemmata sp.]
MPRARFVLAALGVALVTLSSGCITLYSKTEVVRGDEQPRPIQFESAQAADTFNRARKERSAHLGGTHLGVPFLTVYEKDRQLSENAHFNDCVARCDTNQDGFITYTEAQIFAKAKD